jgi:hypothetical protein
LHRPGASRIVPETDSSREVEMRLVGSLGVGFVAVVLSATAVVAQGVTTLPPVHTAPPVATISPSICVPDATNTATSCTPPSPLPPLTPAPLPVPKTIVPPTPSSPRRSLVGGSSSGGAAIGDDKVLSYFQRNMTRVDTSKAFGFVVMPRSAVTAQEKHIQTQFCQITLASMDFADAEAAARTTALVTYWPIVATPSPAQIESAFAARDCDRLIAWYDHRLARAIASRADVAALSGPFLITWPSEGAGPRMRDPLIVDFAVADYGRATKALQYWFGELRQKPSLWTSRIREGTIRAELADAINDTAGVMVAVLAGKWDSVTVVSDTP